MANTMKALQTVTVGAGGAASISFTNIPQTYTDLIVKVSARGTQAPVYASTNPSFNDLYINQNSIFLYGSGTGVTGTSRSPANPSATGAAATASTFSNGELYITNYTSSFYKSFSINNVQETNGTEAYIESYGGQLNNSLPITSLGFRTVEGTFVQNSTFTLYGVFNQDVSTVPPVVTVGTVTAGIESASVPFTAVSGAASYTATSTPGSFTKTGTASPLVVTGLTGGTAYTFTIKANNPFGSSTSAASNSITALYQAYDSIASTVVGAGGSPSEILFSSIPSGYTHLQLRFVGRSLASAPNDSILIRYNGDYGTNYVIHRVYGEATGPSGGQGFTSQTYTIIGDMPAATASSSQTVGTSVVDILDYNNTNKNTTTRILSGRNENGVGYIWLNSSLWLNTAAITSITVLAANGSLAQYSRASLYGIKGA